MKYAEETMASAAVYFWRGLYRVWPLPWLQHHRPSPPLSFELIPLPASAEIDPFLPLRGYLHFLFLLRKYRQHDTTWVQCACRQAARSLARHDIARLSLNGPVRWEHGQWKGSGRNT
jgi:hypothetical protein